MILDWADFWTWPGSTFIICRYSFMLDTLCFWGAVHLMFFLVNFSTMNSVDREALFCFTSNCFGFVIYLWMTPKYILAQTGHLVAATTAK